MCNTLQCKTSYVQEHIYKCIYPRVQNIIHIRTHIYICVYPLQCETSCIQGHIYICIYTLQCETSYISGHVYMCIYPRVRNICTNYSTRTHYSTTPRHLRVRTGWWILHNTVRVQYSSNISEPKHHGAVSTFRIWILHYRILHNWFYYIIHGWWILHFAMGVQYGWPISSLLKIIGLFCKRAP